MSVMERSNGASSTLRAAGLAAATTLAARALLVRLMTVKLGRDIEALNAGDYRPVLSNFAADAVLRFNDGDHRWAGEHHGRAAVERFLQNFVGAGIRGELKGLAVAGPPWRMTLMARFDDQAHDLNGREIYRNRAALVARARWGRIVMQEDFFEDTRRIETFEGELRELGVQPASGRPARDPGLVA